MIPLDYSYYLFVVDTTGDAEEFHADLAAHCTGWSVRPQRPFNKDVPKAMRKVLGGLEGSAPDEEGDFTSSTEVLTPNQKQKYGGAGFVMSHKPSKEVQEFLFQRAKTFDFGGDIDVLGYRILRVSANVELCSDSYDTDIQPFVDLGYPVIVHEAGYDDDEGFPWYQICGDDGMGFGAPLDSKCWYKDKEEAEAFAKRINDAIPKYSVLRSFNSERVLCFVIGNVYGNQVTEDEYSTQEEAEAAMAQMV